MRLSKAARRLLGVSLAAVGALIVSPSAGWATDCELNSGQVVCTYGSCCDDHECGTNCTPQSETAGWTHNVDGAVNCQSCFVT
jgi:hypothetical protein